MLQGLASLSVIIAVFLAMSPGSLDAQQAPCNPAVQVCN